MGRPFKTRTLEELDEMLLGLRIGRAERRAVGSWLRAIRQATKIPVEEITREMGVTKWEIFRLEQSEAKGSIQIASLRNAARGLNCELVYALVPMEGSLKEMAERAAEDREKKLREAQSARAQRLKPWMEQAGAHELLIDGIRKALQRYYGVRVNPVRQLPDEREIRELFEKAGAAVRLARGAEMAMRSGGGERGSG